VRFSGGEPTIYKYLGNLVSFCKGNQVERIAISTNGSADISLYEDLFNRGVNDFSISLDSGCCSIGDKMAGGVSGAWERVIETIKYLSKRTYVTVGMVFTEENINQCLEYVLFADSLGVSHIRVIPSAQYNKALSILTKLPEEILNKHKILKYRINNINSGKHVRGLQKNDCNRCWLGLDDMVCVGGYHFPCIIHMREGGDPIGKIGQDIRTQRESWVKNHNCQTDPICIKNCLDVCRDYNNKYEELHDKTS
jgi:MoaA/NifB/PqqE/SkfB family radical SAM enzyme